MPEAKGYNKVADTVFLLNYPLDTCLCGAESRIGTRREDLPWVETELDEEFRQWIVDFPIKELPTIYQMMENYKDKVLIVFKSRQEADRYLTELKATN